MWENNVNPLSLQQEPCPCTRPIRRAPLEKQEKTLNSQWLTALKTFGLLCQNSNTACGEDICAAASACSTSCIQPSCHMYVCVFSSCSVSVSASLSISSLQSHFGSVSERCSRRGSSSQHTAHYLAERTPSLWQMTDTVHIPESLSLFLLRAHQTRVDRLKRWPAGLVCWALGSSFFFFFFFLSSLFSCQRLCLWPLVARQAVIKRSSLQLSSQTAMIVLQGRQKIASAFWCGVQ